MSHSRLLSVAFTFILAAGLLAGLGSAAAWAAGTQLPAVTNFIYLPFAVRPPEMRTGWAIGTDPSGTAVILHTADGGAHWTAQGDKTQWQNRNGNDISAVDEQTAWAAMEGSNTDSAGTIVHTTDGGITWYTQTLPSVVEHGIKGIKGLSRDVAWAASLDGVILHTTDGGTTWTAVPHSSAPITQVNRIDAIGNNIWVADVGGGDHGIVHSPDNGLTWRQEVLPVVLGNNGPLALNAFSPTVVWAAVNAQLDFYRTVDGGLHWEKPVQFGGLDNDLDDLCAAAEDRAWAVYNLNGGMGGTIYRVQTHPGSAPTVEQFNPIPGYMYEGVTCLDGNTAWVAGYRGSNVGADKPRGIILGTVDGGAHWTSQSLSETDFEIWKISFVGAHR